MSFLQQMELLVLSKLKWDLASVTPHDFMEHFLSKLNIHPGTKQILRKHAQTFVALCATGMRRTSSSFIRSGDDMSRDLTLTLPLSSPDVNFIASPSSMVAAGSVVAAVQGLYLKSPDSSLSAHNLTNFLSQIIRSDPVRHTAVCLSSL